MIITTQTSSSGTLHTLHTFTRGGQTRPLLLPEDGCEGDPSPILGLDGSPGRHAWGMPINCYAHDYAHLAGIGCWKCGEHHFFVKPFCPEEGA